MKWLHRLPRKTQDVVLGIMFVVGILLIAVSIARMTAVFMGG